MTAPSLAVALEFARALGGLALVPPRLAGYLLTRARHEAAVRGDLASEPPPLPDPADLAPLAATGALTERPLRVLVSAAEHSGEIHAANLIDALRHEASAAGLPEPDIRGLGGRALIERGMTSIGDPGSRAAMGFDGVLKTLPFYLGLLRDTTACARDWQPDLFLPVDSPALHVPLARLVRSAGSKRPKVAHFVTPQYWGWAPWRVRGYRKVVDLGLSILPFEPAWYARHGVPATYVGHPLLDELAALDADGHAREARRDQAAPAPSGPLALLPGSRAGVVRRNLPWMLDRVAELQAMPAHQDLEVFLPHSRRDLDPLFHELLAASPARVALVTGPLHEELSRAAAALTVSGTVVLDLLPHRLPTVVLYRLKNSRQGWMRDHILTCPWFTSVNLLANEEVHPEFAFHGEGPTAAVTAALSRALTDGAWRSANLAGQERAAARLGGTGATRRAARAALELLPGLAPSSARGEDPPPA
jgi:lipid-A-disaccharide synthase